MPYVLPNCHPNLSTPCSFRFSRSVQGQQRHVSFSPPSPAVKANTTHIRIKKRGTSPKYSNQISQTKFPPPTRNTFLLNRIEVLMAQPSSAEPVPTMWHPWMERENTIVQNRTCQTTHEYRCKIGEVSLPYGPIGSTRHNNPQNAFHTPSVCESNSRDISTKSWEPKLAVPSLPSAWKQAHTHRRTQTHTHTLTNTYPPPRMPTSHTPTPSRPPAS